MNPAACVYRHRNRARNCIYMVEISYVHPRPAKVRTHRHDRQALGLLSSNGGLGGAETCFRASKISPRAERLGGCSFVCHSGQRTVGEWINDAKVLIDGKPDDAREREFVFFELIVRVGQTLFGSL